MDAETSADAQLDQSLHDLSLECKSEDALLPGQHQQQKQARGEQERQLTADELEKLGKDMYLVNEFKQRRYEIEAKKNWDLFYRRNKANFFKDRYWTFREFEELNDSAAKLLLEIGCGVGNFIFPLLGHNKSIFVYACDFSDNAIALLKANPEYDTERASAFVCDVTQRESLRKGLDAQKRLGPYSSPESSPEPVQVDVVTLIFVLSAIHPTKMRQAVLNIAQILKPGGLLLIRDYGVNDHSMIRFEPGHKLDDKFYVRQDGTRTFFFSLAEIDRLLLTPFSPGEEIDHNPTDAAPLAFDLAADSAPPLFEKVANEYVFRETVNIKENLRVPRVFVQSKFTRTSAKH